MGPGRDAMLGHRFFTVLGRDHELATSKRFSFIRSGHLNTTDGNFYVIHAARDNNRRFFVKNKVLIIKDKKTPSFRKAPECPLLLQTNVLFRCSRKGQSRFIIL
jgi:hypothetical protein